MSLKIKLVLGVCTAVVLFCGWMYIKYLRSEIKILTNERNVAEQGWKQCKADQKITSEVSNDLQGKLSALDKQYRDLKRVHNNATCVPTPRAPSGRDAAPGSGEYAGSHGIMAGDLIDFAAEGEHYRLQLISCHNFINKTWNRDGTNR